MRKEEETLIHLHRLFTVRTVRKPLVAAACVTILAVACGGATESDVLHEPEVANDSDVGQTSDELYVSAVSRWPGDIQVCWEQTGNDVSGTQLTDIRNWSQDAVNRRWGGFSVTQFWGWGSCPSTTTFFNGVRVVVKTGRAHAYGLGTSNTGIVNGVQLNTHLFGGNPSEPDVRETAVHEFGHVLGYSHEQNRPNTPADCLPCTTNSDCADPDATCVAGHCHQGGDGDTQVGAWDRNSVMSYCGSHTDIPTYTDITGHQLFYAKPSRLPGLTANVTTTEFGTNTGVAYVSQDGTVRFGTIASGASTANWGTLSVSNTVPAGGGVTMAKRGATGILDVFFVTSTGALRVVSRSAGGVWGVTATTAANVAPPGAKITVGDSQAHVLDVFFVGNDGAIKQLWSDNNFATLRTITSANFAAPGAGITAALEDPSHLDVFVVGTNGAVKMVQGNGTTFPNNWTLSDPNLAPSGAPLTAAQVGDGDLNVFLVGKDGAVKNVYFFFGLAWFTVNASATGFAPPGGRVGATPLASGSRIDVFVVANNGALYDANQTGSSGTWSAFTIASPAAIGPAGASVAATSVNSVFSVINSGLARTALSFGGSTWVGAPFY